MSPVAREVVEGVQELNGRDIRADLEAAVAKIQVRHLPCAMHGHCHLLRLDRTLASASSLAHYYTQGFLLCTLLLLLHRLGQDVGSNGVELQGGETGADFNCTQKC
jgi:hypothetical protein